jgi:hypothetical protein
VGGSAGRAPARQAQAGRRASTRGPTWGHMPPASRPHPTASLARARARQALMHRGDLRWCPPLWCCRPAPTGKAARHSGALVPCNSTASGEASPPVTAAAGGSDGERSWQPKHPPAARDLHDCNTCVPRSRCRVPLWWLCACGLPCTVRVASLLICKQLACGGAVQGHPVLLQLPLIP